jgi:beta-lactamase class A
MTKLLSIFIFSFIYFQSFAQTKDELRETINQIIATKNATVAISIKGIEDKDTLNINGNLEVPMMSVFKFHIALTVLNQVDKGKLSLNQKVFVKKEDLLPDTWSPIRDDYPNGNIY